jgi:hypothetical protein
MTTGHVVELLAEEEARHRRFADRVQDGYISTARRARASMRIALRAIIGRGCGEGGGVVLATCQAVCVVGWPFHGSNGKQSS